MKKIFLFCFVLTSFFVSHAQNSNDAVFTTKDLVWYGLDFTKATFVGQFDQGFGAMPAKGYDMRTKWIPQWNNLIPAEPKKYDLKKAFRKDNVYYDLGPVAEVNSKLNEDKIMSFNQANIDRATFDVMISKYGVGDKKEGLGCVFIVEYFNKNEAIASIYVTFFDIATKKILLCEKVKGKALGVGMRNYWAGSIKDILTIISETEYKKWK